MASTNVTNWDEPLDDIISDIAEEEEIPEDTRREAEKLERLQKYVQRMAYKPTEPPCVRPRTLQIAVTKKRSIIDNYREFANILTPKQRRQRMKHLAAKYTAISTEQLEQIIKSHKIKERKKEELLKRKQELYYEMLMKLERQCRTQYLNVLIRKFANFIAKLATTMRIPAQLVEPYSRMQRGIFCNILLAMGVQPSNQAAIYYTTPEAVEYEVCHKLAHALLSLIIKGLDSASTKNPDEIQPLVTDFEMDNYIKDRLMCAAEKKLLNTRNQMRIAEQLRAEQTKSHQAVMKRCEYFSASPCP